MQALINILWQVLASTSTTARTPSHALVMLVLVAALLGGFVFLIGLITIMRRRSRRTAGEKRKTAEAAVDPWREAGQRAEF